MDLPKVRESYDFQALIMACKAYIEFMASKEFNEDVNDDYERDVFERAIEAVYGEEVWGWINERIV